MDINTYNESFKRFTLGEAEALTKILETYAGNVECVKNENADCERVAIWVYIKQGE